MTERTPVEVPVADDRRTPGPSILIMALGRRLRTEIERDLADAGLTLRHLSALGHLGREPGLSYSELARRAGVTAQSMQATLQQLEALGAVERRTPPGRGRTAELHLTDAGIRLRNAGMETVATADRELLRAMPEEDAATLGELLVQLLRGQRGAPRP
jgi:DNA-binding MarR family transcriptional regulator